MSRICHAAAACGMVVLLAAAGLKADEPARIGVLTPENWRLLAPQGKEVDAIYGDVVLRNDHLIAVIAAPTESRHANMTVRGVGGCLIDLTTTADQSDQLSAFYPGSVGAAFRNWSAADADGKPLPLDGAVGEGRGFAVTVTSEATPGRPAIAVTYSLNAADRALEVASVHENRSDGSLAIAVVDTVRADGGKEDMRKSPNGVHSQFQIDDRYWGQAYVVAADGEWTVQSGSDARNSSLKHVSPSGQSLFETPAGASVTVRRRVAPGRSLLHAEAALRARSTPVALALRGSRGEPIAEASIQVGDAVLRSDRRGEIQFPAAAGEYPLAVSLNGVSLLKGRTLNVRDALEPQQESIVLSDYSSGLLNIKVTDSHGGPLPCKIEFQPLEGAPLPNFGPETAEWAVRNLRYTADGRVQQPLHPGKYALLISRGPEYEVAREEVEVTAGETTSINAQLHRSVDTSGWVSADFHSHSSPSGDNTGSQFGRVLNLLCEHIEFAPCTEHNRISSYASHIERLKIGALLASCSGMELTGQPLPLNHQNAFPLKERPRTQDGGGPVTDGSPELQMARLALWDDRSEKFVQQNHPDIGWLFFDKDGDGKVDDGHAKSFGFMDAMEIHPIDAAWNLSTDKPARGDSQQDRIVNWLQLQNLGHRIAGVVNTDAHYNYHGSGGLRNWIQSPTDLPDQIQVIDIVHASEQGRLIMSNGPFLEVTARAASGDGKAVTVGQELAAPGGEVELTVRVQAPRHIAVDEVFVLLNGRPAPKLRWQRAAGEAQDQSLCCETTWKTRLEGDTQLVVVAGSRTATLGPAFGPAWGGQHPTALSNPIYVDVDGGGFKPNRDTLGLGLPVKGGARTEP